MPLINTLMETAKADTDLLYKLDSQGDDFGVARDVDFLLRARDRAQAEIACDFINEHQYGVATTQETGGEFSVLVVVHTPIQQQIICSISGFMACVCELFGLDYDGWGCVVSQRT